MAKAKKKLPSLFSSDEKKRQFIKDMKFIFCKQGFPPWKAVKLAEQHYNGKG